MRMLDSTLS